MRVGDPNQAIYETFTTANPDFLRNFMQRPDVIARSFPTQDGQPLGSFNLANYLVDWTNTKHPLPTGT